MNNHNYNHKKKKKRINEKGSNIFKEANVQEKEKITNLQNN